MGKYVDHFEAAQSSQPDGGLHVVGKYEKRCAERQHTAWNLLYHDDQLAEAERNALWSDQHMPCQTRKADMSPAKRKLIEIRL